MFLKKVITAGAFALMGSTAMAMGHAGCPTEGRVSIVGNEFPAIQTVGAGAMACAAAGAMVETNLTA
ncbi:MAG: sugar ABC transporter substrate-binding protein, partial [Pseudomonadota bacterium]